MDQEERARGKNDKRLTTDERTSTVRKYESNQPQDKATSKQVEERWSVIVFVPRGLKSIYYPIKML